MTRIERVEGAGKMDPSLPNRNELSTERGVGWIMENGVKKAETSAKVKRKFIELLGRTLKDHMIDYGRGVETAKIDRAGIFVLPPKREFIESKDDVCLVYKPSEENPKGMMISLSKEKYFLHKDKGKNEIEHADPVWRQLMDKREKLGVDPYYVIWWGSKVVATDDGCYGNKEIFFERGIPFKEIELDFLKIASEEEKDGDKASKYRAEYLKKRMNIKSEMGEKKV